MARNVEKSQNVLNRLLNAKAAELRTGGGPSKPTRRPFLASECSDLAEADKWRAQVVREIGSKVMEIQNAGLGEAKLRDLNDEINKLLREKGHWERRIVELGGPDYSKVAPAAGGASDGGSVASSSSSASASRGSYRYFGAAKLLPGVKELFEAPPVAGRGAVSGTGRKKRPELVAGSGGDYFGFRDEEENPQMLKEEAAADGARDARLMREWEEEHGDDGGGGGAGAAAAAAAAATRRRKRGGGSSDEEDEGLDSTADVVLPDKEELEATIVARKKAALLAKYA